MSVLKISVVCLFLVGGVAAHAGNEGASTIETVYATHCQKCHGPDRLGGEGPALLPGNLKRLPKKAAKQVILHGRVATQMPPYAGILTADEVDRLVTKIYTKPAQPPTWDMAAIKASHVVHANGADLPAKPIWDADPQNLFVVVETGDHHVTLVDGDTFAPIHRFPTRFALHGGPKYSRDGRFVFFASRDGWISKYDLYNLQMVAEVRAGINTRNAAVGFDGRFVAVGNYLPHQVVILDATDLQPLQILDTAAIAGKTSRISAVYTAPPRGSFIVALKDIPQLWELPYKNAEPGKIPVRPVTLTTYLDDFFFDPDYRYVLGASRPVASHVTNASKGSVIELDSGTTVSELALEGMPHLGSGITWMLDGRRVLASPNLKDGTVVVIDMNDWSVIKRIDTLGPGFFMRSHANSPYVWVDVFFGPHKDKMHVIDKQSLEIVKTLCPVPGKTAAHVDFTRNGSHALLSIWDPDGAVIVYDAKTLAEVKRLPMNKPSGKYNVYNKTHYEEGTSH